MALCGNLGQRLANFSCKELKSKYFRLCRLHIVSVAYFLLPLSFFLKKKKNTSTKSKPLSLQALLKRAKGQTWPAGHESLLPDLALGLLGHLTSPQDFTLLHCMDHAVIRDPGGRK